MVKKALSRITRLVKKKKGRLIGSRKAKGAGGNESWKKLDDDRDKIEKNVTLTPASNAPQLPTSVSYETAAITEESSTADPTDQAGEWKTPSRLCLPSLHIHDSSSNCSSGAVCFDDASQEDYDHPLLTSPSIPAPANTASFESVEEIANLTPKERVAFHEFIQAPSDEQWRKLVRSLRTEMQRERRRRDKRTRSGSNTKKQRSDSFHEQHSCQSSPPISVMDDLISLSSSLTSNIILAPPLLSSEDSYIGEVVQMENIGGAEEKEQFSIQCRDHDFCQDEDEDCHHLKSECTGLRENATLECCKNSIERKVASSQQDEDLTAQPRLSAVLPNDLMAQKQAIMHDKEVGTGARVPIILSDSRNDVEYCDHQLAIKTLNGNAAIDPLTSIPPTNAKDEESSMQTAIDLSTKSWRRQTFILVPTAIYLIRTPTVLILCSLVSMWVILGVLSEAQPSTPAITDSDSERNKNTWAYQFSVVGGSSSSIPSPAETDCLYY